MNQPNLTIVIPTFNEGANVKELLRQISEAFRGLPVQTIFVDDSTDDTPTVIREVAAAMATPELSIQLIHRAAPERTGGLGGAVLAGFHAANAPYALVMDGDCQHPPTAARQLYECMVTRGSDLVVGTRYRGEGRPDGLSRIRVFISRSTGLMAKLMFPRCLRGISDPMSGLFAVRLGAIAIDNLTPQGFKILLEVAVHHPYLHRDEVAYVFADRTAGQSKGNVAQGLLYFRRLLSLRLASA